MSGLIEPARFRTRAGTRRRRQQLVTLPPSHEDVVAAPAAMDSACLSVVGGFVPPPDGARPLRLSARDRGDVRVHSGRVAAIRGWQVKRSRILLQSSRMGPYTRAGQKREL